MQPALPVGFGAELAYEPAKTPSRFNKYLVSGVAVVCAGAIAVNPIAQTTSLTQVHQPAVQLAAWTNPVLENPLSLWGKTFTDSFTQVGAIGASMAADPFPILSQIGENQLRYLKVLLGAKAAEGQRRGTGIIGSAEAVGRSITNIPVRLEAINNFLKNGEFTEALVEINTWALVLGENLFFPLLPVLSIPSEMAKAAGRVYDALVTRGAINTVLKGVMSPALGVAFALANVADQVVRSLKAGNLQEVVTAVLNAPAIAVGAFFNGYRPMFGYDEAGEPILATEFFPGVFSAGGTIDSLFVKLPRTIAAALAPPVAPAAAVPPAATPTLLTLDVAPTDTAVEPSATERAAIAAVSANVEVPVEPAPVVEAVAETPVDAGTVAETVTETVGTPAPETTPETTATDTDAPKAPKKSSLSRSDRAVKKAAAGSGADAGDKASTSSTGGSDADSDAGSKPSKKESAKKAAASSASASKSDKGSDSDSE